MPATRGECPFCGGTVFRMGRTAAHSGQARPAAVQVAAPSRARLLRSAVYINFAAADRALACQISDDLEKAGTATWLHEANPTQVNWAGGVHPSLTACSHMVLVLSPAAVADGSVMSALESFRGQRKPVLIAQVAPAELPDAARRCARFDFAASYQAALRQLVGSI
ncbi:MAG: toll/interleukin-1 receptor domain-containing protein [Aggregatilineales bacterium]